MRIKIGDLFYGNNADGKPLRINALEVVFGDKDPFKTQFFCL
jgi:hypothetical protein